MRISGQTCHFLVSAYGSKWKEVYLAFFTAFIDDSGTAPDQAVAHATALVVPASRIIALEKEWNTLKRKEGFTDFHTSECLARNRKSEFAKWDDEKQARVFRRVREISKKFGVKALSFGVHKKDYDEVIPADFRDYCGRNHYTYAIRHLVSNVIAWRKEYQIDQPLEYISDWIARSDPRRAEIEAVLEMASRSSHKLGQPPEFQNFSFRSRKGIPGLQCVDAIAWSCYQFGIFAYCGKPMSPNALAAWEHLSAHRNGALAAGPRDWLYAFTVTRKNLEKWVIKEREAYERRLKKEQ